MSSLRQRVSRLVGYPPAPRCRSYCPDGRPCGRRVARHGVRCDACWQELARAAEPIQLALVGEDDLPADVAGLLWRIGSPLVRARLLGRPDARVEWVQEAAHDPDPLCRVTAAMHPLCPPDALAELVEDGDPDVSTTATRRLRGE